VRGTCKKGNTPTEQAATVTVSIDAMRGPRMENRNADFQAFIAVLRNGEVLTKRLFPVSVAFPPNVDRLTIASPPVDITLPVSNFQNASSYDIIAGIQLDPEDLAANRAGLGLH
jgi:hypothetical protein